MLLTIDYNNITKYNAIINKYIKVKNNNNHRGKKYVDMKSNEVK